MFSFFFVLASLLIFVFANFITLYLPFTHFFATGSNKNSFINLCLADMWEFLLYVDKSITFFFNRHQTSFTTLCAVEVRRHLCNQLKLEVLYFSLLDLFLHGVITPTILCLFFTQLSHSQRKQQYFL